MTLFQLGLIIAVIVFIIGTIISNIRIVPQANEYVIERLGTYNDTWEAGLHLKIPFIDRVARKISVKEQVVDFPPQNVITRDNVSTTIDTVIYFTITDSVRYTYGVEHPLIAIENLTATTLRSIVGEMELDETLSGRDKINGKMTVILDEATDPWGIKVNRVEVKSITPPRDIQEAMEKQMRAERTKREQILLAEGERQSAIQIAEGKKEAKILQAQAEKEAKILEAEAEKQAQIAIAEGEAVAILRIQQATAAGIEAIKKAEADDKVIKIRSLEALEKVADGQATKIIIPSELQGLAGLAVSAKELVSDSVQK